MLDLALALFLAMISSGVGQRLLSRLGETPEHPLDALALATPLGLGLLALGVLVVGEFGWLNLIGLAVLVASFTEIGVFSGARLLSDVARSWAHRRRTGTRTLIDRAMFTFLCLSLGATALSSMAPVTDGDALCYHLQVPKVFLIRQAVGFDPDLHETVYPLITELLYAIGLEFRGPVACRWLQWVFGLVFALQATALARPSLGTRAWWAGTLALLVPAVSNGMAAPLNDVALAAFGSAAILSWTRFLERRTPASLFVTGIVCGLAIGVKYPALVLVALIILTTFAWPCLVNSWRSREPWIRSASSAFALLAIALLAGGGWYLRAYVHTGNPVYPFFKDWFAGAGLEEVLAPIKRPLPVGIWNLLTSIAPLTVEPQRFDSFAHQFGPVFLFFLPALFFERAPRRVLGLVALAYVFLMACMTQRQSTRFLLIALGPMSVGVAYLAVRWSQRRTVPARLLTAMMVMVLGLETGISLTRGTRAAGVVLGRESFHEFLQRCEPSYRIGRWVSAHLPRSARLIGQDHRGFYIPRDYTMELAHRRRTGLGENGESAEEIVKTLRDEGYTHLIMCPPNEDSAVEFDPTLGDMLSPWLSEQRPLYSEDLSDGEGVVRNYSIYDLSEPQVSMKDSGSVRR
jgi:hypothetical protein